MTLFTLACEAGAVAVRSDAESRLWSLALGAYRQQHWDHAEIQLQQLDRSFPDSTFAGLYRQLGERIDHHRGAPLPPDWDGAHTFDSK
ncbi:MAG: hypothetical protein ABIQ60_07460 [Burkholderiaceae bacterium]